MVQTEYVLVVLEGRYLCNRCRNTRTKTRDFQNGQFSLKTYRRVCGMTFIGKIIVHLQPKSMHAKTVKLQLTTDITDLIVLWARKQKKCLIKTC